MGAGVFYGLWLNSFSGDPTRLNVSSGRQDSLIKVIFPCVGILLEQRKRGLRVVKTGHSKRKEKRYRKAIFQKVHQKQRPNWKSEADNQGFPCVQDHSGVGERGF